MQVSSFQAASIALAVVGAAIQAYILCVLAKRKLFSQMAMFVNYTVFGIAMVAVAVGGYVLTGNGTGPVYFYLYWILSFLYVALEFGVMYEILVNALKPYGALIDLGKLLFAWATVFLLAAAILTGFATAGPQASRMQSAIGVIEHSMRLLQCGLLLLFLLFERRLGLSWRNINVSIGLGLGATAAMDLSVSYLKVHFVSMYYPLSMVNAVFYMGVLAFWSYCLALPQTSRKNVLDSPSKLVFQRWNEALQSTPLVAHGKSPASVTVDPFLPGIEKTVDRIMARKIAN